MVVRKVGHIRAYSVMAAIGTVTILLNLLDNARKHGAPATPVALRLLPATGKHGPVVEVQNTLAAPLGARLHQGRCEMPPLARRHAQPVWHGQRRARLPSPHQLRRGKPDRAGP